MSEIDISSFINKSLPPEILDQLKVFNRVQFPMKPTVTSAISSVEDKEQLAEDRINDLVDHVKDMESICKQIEDSIDLLTKDMNIPPKNDSIADAAKRLGNPDGNITKDVMDKALAIMDYFPALNGLGDPILGALTGDSSIDGENWLECDQITSSLASSFKINAPTNNFNEPIQEKTSNVMFEYEAKQQNMMIEMLQMLFWNMLWCKYIVDSNLNTVRTIIANPLDAMILFFKKFPFRKPSQKDIETKGPINKLINKIRRVLLCKVPPKAYPRYKPMVNIDCGIDGECNKPKDVQDHSGASKLEDMGNPTASVLTDDPCITADDFFGKLDRLRDQNPDKFGASPECTKAAKIILDAIMSDALTPPGDSKISTFITEDLKNTIGGL